MLRASSATTAAFDVLGHGDLGGITANQHHNQVHNIVGSDHTLTGSQYQIVGATATNTLGLLTPSTDVGTTPAAAILRSTAAGALTLKSLAVMGNVDVTDGGDLYVAASGFYAGNPVIFADSSGGNVGILTIPDPQFALDVNGPLRAQYLIGPHAIQVKDALMICHYDGPERGALGEPNGHFGQVATITGDVLHRPGKFGKAIELSESVVNLISNPSFETDTTGWANYFTGSSTATRTRTDDEAWAGFYSYRISKTAGANVDRSGTVTTYAVTNGQNYAVTVRVKVTAAVNATGNILIVRTESNVNGVQAGYTAADGEWVELVLNTTATATGTADLYVWLQNCDTGTVYVRRRAGDEHAGRASVLGRRRCAHGRHTDLQQPGRYVVALYADGLVYERLTWPPSAARISGSLRSMPTATTASMYWSA